MATEQNNRIAGNPEDHRVWSFLRKAGWSAAAIIILLPAVAMLFTDEVNWTLSDFIAAAIILGGTGLVFELALRRSVDNAYRTGVVVALAASFLLIWSNAAVGFIGAGANAANVLYFAMLGITLTGALAAGFTAKGLSITMIATALAQLLITLFAFAIGLVQDDPSAMIIAINAFFIALWLAAAVLFHRSSLRNIH